MTLTIKKNKKSDENCLFCEWTNDLEQFKKSKDGQIRWLTENSHFFAMLDSYPKVTGHTLVISKKHYADLTEIIDSKTKHSLGHILVNTSELLKKGLGAEKVYIMSMCEHWELDEINPNWKKLKKPPRTTEHLHFHLLPRYKEMRTKEIAQENMFVRPQDYGYTLEQLDVVRKKILFGNH